MAVSVSCLTSCYCDKYAVGTINPEEPLVRVSIISISSVG